MSFNTVIIQVLIFVGVGAAFGASLLLLSLFVQHFFGIPRATPLKLSPYECGVRQIGKSRIQFDVKYYVLALLFIVFDVEFVFLIPWALRISQAKGNIFTLSTGDLQVFCNLLFEALMFVAILGSGLYYAWRKNALEWE